MHNERRELEQQFNDTPTSSIHTYISQLWTLDRPPLTSWWGNSTSTILHSLFGEPNPQEQDLPFVYRDFPRHDGTPCLIYNPKNEPTTINDTDDDDTHVLSTRSQSPSPTLPQSFSLDMDDILDMPQPLYWDHNYDASPPMPSNSMHSTTSAHSISSTNSLEQFIDRLENLYQLKQKQYQQRMEMERERRERRLAQESKVGVSVQTPTKPTKSVSTPSTASTTASTTSPEYSLDESLRKKSHVSLVVLRTPDVLPRSSLSYETPMTESPMEIRPMHMQPTLEPAEGVMSPNHSVEVDEKSAAIGIV